MRTIFGIFEDREDAEFALTDLDDAGYNPENFSIIMRDEEKAEELERNTGAEVTAGAATGATTGAVVGGIAGLLIGIGTIAVPGVGALLIGGPLAAALGLTGAAAITAEGAMTGALAGGLIGALTGIGVPKEEARLYEQKIREGATLLAIPVEHADEEEVMDILAQNNASDINSLDLEDQEETKREETVIHDHTHAEPRRIQKYLQFADYPATKDDLVHEAEEEGADEEVVKTLEELPEKDYKDPASVNKAIGRIS